MRRFYFLLICLTLLLPLCAHSQNQQPRSKTRSDLVVAEVNQTKITHEQVDAEMQRRLPSQSKSLSAEQLHLVRKHVVKTMIERELLMQAAEDSEVKVTSEEIDALAANIKKQTKAGGSFEDFLSRNNLDEKKFHSLLHNDLLLSKYMEQIVFQGIQAADAEARALYENEPDRFRIPTEIRARHILFRLEEDASENEVASTTAKAQRVLRIVRGDSSNFEKAAKEYSEGPTRAKGGDLGYFTRNQMVPEFAQAAFSLKPGEISDLVRTNFGIHIIKVEDIRGGQIPPFEEISESIKKQIIEDRRNAALAKHLEQLKSSNKVIQYVN